MANPQIVLDEVREASSYLVTALKIVADIPRLEGVPQMIRAADAAIHARFPELGGQPTQDAVALLFQLREEVRDWEEALGGEREGLDELCARVDSFLACPADPLGPVEPDGLAVGMVARHSAVPSRHARRCVIKALSGRLAKVRWSGAGEDEDFPRRNLAPFGAD